MTIPTLEEILEVYPNIPKAVIREILLEKKERIISPNTAKDKVKLERKVPLILTPAQMIDLYLQDYCRRFNLTWNGSLHKTPASQVDAILAALETQK